MAALGGGASWVVEQVPGVSEPGMGLIVSEHYSR
jgi:hypothetical protein